MITRRGFFQATVGGTVAVIVAPPDCASISPDAVRPPSLSEEWNASWSTYEEFIRQMKAACAKRADQRLADILLDGYSELNPGAEIG